MTIDAPFDYVQINFKNPFLPRGLRSLAQEVAQDENEVADVQFNGDAE